MEQVVCEFSRILAQQIWPDREFVTSLATVSFESIDIEPQAIVVTFSSASRYTLAMTSAGSSGLPFSS